MALSNHKCTAGHAEARTDRRFKPRTNDRAARQSVSELTRATSPHSFLAGGAPLPEDKVAPRPTERARRQRIRPHEGDPSNARRRGRGAQSNVTGRFERFETTAFDDGWDLDDEPEALHTSVTLETPKRIITKNQSPDISFDRSINPYRGCEHGCSYCFARPTHAFMGLSPGLDFETRLFAKPNAAELLEQELAAPGYEPRTLAIGTNTDPYQPVEREFKLMRGILEVLSNANHPVGIVTKSALITRDIDILAPMAERGLVQVALSVTSLDRTLARRMEPRAATPAKRLDAISQLSDAGIPTTIMTAPIIPALNDMELERLLDAGKASGADGAGYVLLRLPLEVSPLFQEWLKEHYPDRLKHVMSVMRDMRGGKDYDAIWGERLRGKGPYAWTIGRRFELATKRLGMNKRRTSLRTDLFRPPALPGQQMQLI